MEGNNKVNYYCFNKKCESSIFSAKCVVMSASFNATLTLHYCQECYKELVSKEELSIKIQLSQILQDGKILTSFIIDDDPVYHVVVKKLFEHSTAFDRPDHYMDGPGALDYLAHYQDRPDIIPDVIFLDVNMPEMNAWEFLNEFSNIYPLLKKKVDVYVMTTKFNPRYAENVKVYPYVKGVISKHFNLNFLNSLAV